MNKLGIKIFHNAQVIASHQEKVYEAVAVDSLGYVVDLGAQSELAAKFPQALQCDLGGATVLPAFWDCHAHPFGVGEKVLLPDLSLASSIEEIIELLKPYQAKNPEGWIITRGWDQTKWQDKSFPSYESLDCFSQPVSLIRIDGHALWCNSACLKKCHIDAKTITPAGGEIIKQSGGKPTGILIDEAMKLVKSCWPPLTTEKMKNIFEIGLKHFFKHGVIGVHDMGVSAEMWEAYKLLYREKGDELPYAQVFLDMITYPTGKELFLNKCREGIFSDSSHQRLRLIGIKLYFDGALGSRGAKLLDDYSDASGNNGLELMEDEEVEKLVFLAVAKNLQVAIHAIGDAACRRALDVFEKARKKYPNSSAILRIEHAQIVHPEDLKRFQSLGVHAVVQPAFYPSDYHWAIERLGTKRIEHAYRWQSLLDNHIHVVASSDAPIETASVIFGMQALVHSSRPESVSVSTAIKLYSQNAVKLSGDNSAGVIEVGKRANFSLVELDEAGLPTQIRGCIMEGRLYL